MSYLHVTFTSEDILDQTNSNTSDDTISENTIKAVTANTGGLGTTVDIIPSQKYASLEVMACSDVTIMLVDNTANTSYDAYHIILGGWGNTRSAIYDTNTALFQDLLARSQGRTSGHHNECQ